MKYSELTPEQKELFDKKHIDDSDFVKAEILGLDVEIYALGTWIDKVCREWNFKRNTYRLKPLDKERRAFKVALQNGVIVGIASITSNVIPIFSDKYRVDCDTEHITVIESIDGFKYL